MLTYTNFLKILVSLVVAGGLFSCAGYQSPRQYPANLVLRLNQDITVESGRARVFLQNGKVTRTGQLQTYEPSCDFEVIEVSRPGAEQVIAADEFRVTRIFYAPPEFTQVDFELNQQYAYERFEYLNTTFRTEFSLKSENQPDVFRLNCKIWSIDPWQKYLTPAQIEITLGTVATFITE